MKEKKLRRRMDSPGHHGGGAEDSLRRGAGGEEVPDRAGADPDHRDAARQQKPEGAAAGAGQALHLRHHARGGSEAAAGVCGVFDRQRLPLPDTGGVPGAARHPAGQGGPVPRGDGGIFPPGAERAGEKAAHLPPQKGGSGIGGAGCARPAGTAGGGKPLRGAARPAQRAFAEAEHPGVSDLHQRLADRYGSPPAGHDGGISAGLRRGRV